MNCWREDGWQISLTVCRREKNPRWGERKKWKTSGKNCVRFSPFYMISFLQNCFLSARKKYVFNGSSILDLYSTISPSYYNMIFQNAGIQPLSRHSKRFQTYITRPSTLKNYWLSTFFYLIDYWCSSNNRIKNINCIKYFFMHSQSLHLTNIFCNLNVFFLSIKCIVIIRISHHCIRYEWILHISKFLNVKVFFLPRHPNPCIYLFQYVKFPFVGFEHNRYLFLMSRRMLKNW